MFSSAMDISQQAAAIFLYVYIVSYFDFLFGSQYVALSNPHDKMLQYHCSW